MGRTWHRALSGAPLFFEPVPPAARLSAERIERQTHAVADLVTAVERIDAINVPELVDENHEGRPRYRSGDVRAYARTLAAATGREVVVNKVVAHLDDEPALRRWAEECVELGLRHAVLVGGSSRYIPYPGPPVVEANRICAPVFSAARGGIGNIAIPQRTGEAHRMLAKTIAGASFFTTQILFDAVAPLATVEAYDHLCIEAHRAPAPVLLSVAPLIDESDVEFVRWLGADVPEAVEHRILAGGESDFEGAAQRSTERALDVWRAVEAGAIRGHLSVPIGVNVEQLSIRHLAHAGRMAESIAAVLPPVRSESPT